MTLEGKQIFLKFLRFLWIAGPACGIVLIFPPNWNFVDSALYFINSAKGSFPHYPPGFPYMLKFTHWLFGGEITPPAIFPTTESSIVQLTLIGTWSTACINLAIISCSLLYLTESISPALKKQAYFIAPVLGILSLEWYLFAYGFYAESAALGFQLLMVGALIRIFLGTQTRRTYYLFAVAGIISFLLRHATLFMFPILGLLVLATLLLRQYRTARNLGVAILIFAIDFLMVKFALSHWATKNGLYNASIWGRASIYNVAYAVLELPGEEKQKVVDRLVQASDKRLLKRAIPIALLNNSPWSGTYDQMRSLFPKLSGVSQNEAVDRILKEVTIHYYTHPDKYLFSILWKTFTQYQSTNMAYLSSAVLGNTRSSYELYCLKKVYENRFDRICPFLGFYDASLGKIASFLLNNSKKFSVLSSAGVLGIFVLALVGMAVLGKGSKQMFYGAIALISASHIQIIIYSIISIAVLRYGLLSEVLNWSALLLLLTGGVGANIVGNEKRLESDTI